EPAGEILHRDAAPDDSQMWRLRHLASIHVGCNNADLYQEEGAWHSSGDPTEAALLSSGRKIGTYHGISEKDGFLQEYPFDSDTKRHGIFRRLPDGKIRLLMNGAPDVLLGLCSRELSAEGEQALTEEMRRQILEANAGMAERALRVIASAYRDFDGLSPLPGRAEAERDLVFTGLAGIQDAPRPEAAVAVAQCHEAGIRVLMITGDHPRTALAVARELGIARDETEVISGSELDAMPEEQLREAVQRATVFARVTAGHKLRIVKALRSHGAVTAMTGDGVNDAPALKASDIGIAMGRGGTEVTKQAADLVLADDNFASIVAAVEEGRGVYFNIRKSLQYLLAGNAGELLVMILPMLWGWPLPLLPVHLLWINLVTDGLPALVLAADPADASLMRRKPRNHGEQLANRSFILGLLGTGCLTAGVSLIAFWIGLRSGDIVAARADAFDTLVLSEVFRALAYYSEERPFWRSKWRSLRLLLGVVFGSLALQIAVHEIPLFEQVLRVESRDWKSSGIMIGLSLIPLIVLEARKVFFRKF
ncbi:MAG TPA: cation-translocating P-type ATPase, partial [Fibrobacteres bacterium]|nr:cation-translocating P-type ATPase [Fibrobacterota bacterium]